MQNLRQVLYWPGAPTVSAVISFWNLLPKSHAVFLKTVVTYKEYSCLSLQTDSTMVLPSMCPYVAGAKEGRRSVRLCVCLCTCSVFASVLAIWTKNRILVNLELEVLTRAYSYRQWCRYRPTKPSYTELGVCSSVLTGGESPEFQEGIPPSLGCGLNLGLSVWRACALTLSYGPSPE